MKLTKILALSFTVMLLGSCAEELTEIVVSVDVTAGVPCTVDTLVVRVSDRGEMSQTVIDPDLLPATLSIVWAGGSQDVVIESVGLKDGVEVLTSAASVRFVTGQSMFLPMTLSDSCESGCTVQLAGSFEEDDLPEAAGTESCECPPENPRCNDAPIESYSVSVDSFTSHADACELPNAIQLITDGDDIEVEVPQSIKDLLEGDFEFYYYGQRISTMFVSEDGYIGLGMAAPGLRPSAQDIKPSPLNDSVVSRRTVFPFWDNLEVAGPGSVCVAVTSTVPRTILVSWSRACFKSGCPGGDDLNFSASFEETEDTVKFTYGTMSSQDASRALGSFAVSGITGPSNGSCGAAMCDESGMCPDGSACGFTQVFERESQEALPALAFQPIK